MALIEKLAKVSALTLQEAQIAHFDMDDAMRRLWGRLSLEQKEKLLKEASKEVMQNADES